MTIDDEIAKIDKEYPLTPHTNARRVYSTARRMKAEKERNIPIERRTGFAVSVKSGKAANNMTRREWESFYKTLSKRLKTDYPDSYLDLFPTSEREE
jgi:hypothetical protein